LQIRRSRYACTRSHT